MRNHALWKTIAALLLSFLNVSNTACAQLTCSTKNARDEATCLGAKDEAGKPCAWCTVSWLGYCINDGVLASAIENVLLNARCSRYVASHPDEEGDDIFLEDDPTLLQPYVDDTTSDDDVDRAPDDDKTFYLRARIADAVNDLQETSPSWSHSYDILG